MNTNKILIYGERFGDLKEARDRLARTPEQPPTREEMGVVAPFARAVGRAHAELLLELADRGGTDIIWPAETISAAAAGRVLREMHQVEVEPLVLHSHPALAAARRSARGNV